MSYCLSNAFGLNWRGKVNAILKKRMLRERKRSSQVLQKPIEVSFPEDILIEILSWLPVKDLLQFKLVCKSWYAIIKNHCFVSKHLKNYCSRKVESNGCLIAQVSVTQAGELNNYQSLVSNKNNVHRVIASEIVETPKYNTYICGPCDGIYYLWCFYKEHDRYLWNPVLNECKSLPPLLLKPNHIPSHIALDQFEFYGFGYDPFMKDYKIVVIKGYHDAFHTDELGFEVEATSYPLSIFIYSLQNDCWSYWGDLSKYYHLKNNKCYVFTNDSSYWLGSLRRYDFCDVIVSFNLATNSVQELQPPVYEKLEPSDDERLVVVHESLALLVGYYEKKHYKLWVFNEENWTNKYMIDLSFVENYWDPIGHWKDNKLIFGGGWCNLGLYDLDTQEIGYLDKKIRGSCENVCAYNESLVSVIDRQMWMRCNMHEEN